MQAQVEALQEAQQFKAPTLRKSTRERIEEAEKERQRAEQVRFASSRVSLIMIYNGSTA